MTNLHGIGSVFFCQVRIFKNIKLPSVNESFRQIYVSTYSSTPWRYSGKLSLQALPFWRVWEKRERALEEERRQCLKFNKEEGRFLSAGLRRDL